MIVYSFEDSSRPSTLIDSVSRSFPPSRIRSRLPSLASAAGFLIIFNTDFTWVTSSLISTLRSVVSIRCEGTVYSLRCIFVGWPSFMIFLQLPVFFRGYSIVLPSRITHVFPCDLLEASIAHDTPASCFRLS